MMNPVVEAPGPWGIMELAPCLPGCHLFIAIEGVDVGTWEGALTLRAKHSGSNLCLSYLKERLEDRHRMSCPQTWLCRHQSRCLP